MTSPNDDVLTIKTRLVLPGPLLNRRLLAESLFTEPLSKEPLSKEPLSTELGIATVPGMLDGIHQESPFVQQGYNRSGC
jgi:hypothetical protein